MGTEMALSLANLSMAKFECVTLNYYENILVRTWLRFIDNIFLSDQVMSKELKNFMKFCDT